MYRYISVDRIRWLDQNFRLYAVSSIWNVIEIFYAQLRLTVFVMMLPR